MSTMHDLPSWLLAAIVLAAVAITVGVACVVAAALAWGLSAVGLVSFGWKPVLAVVACLLAARLCIR